MRRGSPRKRPRFETETEGPSFRSSDRATRRRPSAPHPEPSTAAQEGQPLHTSGTAVAAHQQHALTVSVVSDTRSKRMAYGHLGLSLVLRTTDAFTSKEAKQGLAAMVAAGEVVMAKQRTAFVNKYCAEDATPEQRANVDAIVRRYYDDGVRDNFANLVDLIAEQSKLPLKLKLALYVPNLLDRSRFRILTHARLGWKYQHIPSCRFVLSWSLAVRTAPPTASMGRSGAR